MIPGRRSDPPGLCHSPRADIFGLEGQGRVGFPARATLGPARAVADRGEDALDRVRGPDMLPVLGRKVVEGRKGIAILRRLLHGLSDR